MTRSIAVDTNFYTLTQDSLVTAQLKTRTETPSFEFEHIRSSSIDKVLHKGITEQCVKIANEAQFPTDYQDVYEHLFGGDYELAFLRYGNEIKGFAVFDSLTIDGRKFLHLHGAVFNPKVQQMGYTKKLLLNKIKACNADFFTLKTHNPRMYAVAANIAGSRDKIFPNYIQNVPEYIKVLCKKNHFIGNCDENLVVKGAYPDIKTQQPVADNTVMAGFKEYIKDFDAQAVIVKIC